MRKKSTIYDLKGYLKKYYSSPQPYISKTCENILLNNNKDNLNLKEMEKMTVEMVQNGLFFLGLRRPLRHECKTPHKRYMLYIYIYSIHCFSLEFKNFNKY